MNPDVENFVVLERSTNTTVFQQLGEQRMVTLGYVGVPGAQGAPGPSGGASFTAIADEAIGGDRIVRSTSATNCAYLDVTAEAQIDDLLGITLTAGGVGATITIQRAGDVTEPTWTWTPGLPVYLTVNSLMTQTPPDGNLGEKASIQLGVARSATTVLFDPQPPVYL